MSSKGSLYIYCHLCVMSGNLKNTECMQYEQYECVKEQRINETNVGRTTINIQNC